MIKQKRYLSYVAFPLQAKNNSNYFYNAKILPRLEAPSYGFTPTSSEETEIKADLQSYIDNGGAPDLWLDARSVNYNLATYTKDFANTVYIKDTGVTANGQQVDFTGSFNQKIELNFIADFIPGDFTIKIKAKTVSGSALFRLKNTERAFLDHFSSEFTITETAQEFSFTQNHTGSGSGFIFGLELREPKPISVIIEEFSFVPGDGSNAYRPRLDDTAVQPIDFGDQNANFSFVNYGRADKAGIDSLGNQFIPFNSSLTQTIDSDYTTHNDQVVVEMWLKVDLSSQQCLWNKQSGSSRSFISTNGSVSFDGEAGNLTSPSGTLTDDTIHHIVVAFDASAAATYKSGGSLNGSAAIWVDGTRVVDGDGITITPQTDPWQISRSSLPLNSQVYSTSISFRTINDAEVLNIYNSQKSRFGL